MGLRIDRFDGLGFRQYSWGQARRLKGDFGLEFKDYGLVFSLPKTNGNCWYKLEGHTWIDFLAICGIV